MSKWHLIENQPPLREIYTERPSSAFIQKTYSLEQSFEGHSFLKLSWPIGGVFGLSTICIIKLTTFNFSYLMSFLKFYKK